MTIMGFMSKQTGPVDRAVADIERQIQTLESKIQRLDSPESVEQPPPFVAGITQFVKDALRPPSKKMPAVAKRERHDLFDLPADPLKDIEADKTVLPASAESSYFHQHPGATATITRTTAAVSSEKKLAQYLNAGTFRTQKPVLKHIQKKNKQHFIMWVAMSVVALWLIYVVVR